MKTFSTLSVTMLLLITLMSSECRKPSVPTKVCWNGTVIPVTQECPEQPTVYTVTFNSNGGSSVLAQNVNAGSLVVKPTDPTYTGYTFVGWYTDSELINAYNFNLAVNANINLYAKWSKIITASTWLGAPQVTYGPQFSIGQNAVSSQLTVVLNNSAASVKSATSLIASFGSAGSAVKMLRYQLNGDTKWNILPVTNGNVNFGGINLQPGTNTFICYFAIKVNAGVTNGSALSFVFTSLDDGAGANVPIGGLFQPAVSLGTVNSVTQATVLTTEWAGVMSVPGIVLTQDGTTRTTLFSVTNVRATGPAGARLVSLKLKNPYHVFSGLLFDNSTWAILIQGGPDKNIPNTVWQNEYVTLTLPNETSVITDGTTYNKYYVKCTNRNSSTVIFNSNDYTLGRCGLAITSKYDIVIENADGQVIDLSDATVKQDGVIVQ